MKKIYYFLGLFGTILSVIGIFLSPFVEYPTNPQVAGMVLYSIGFYMLGIGSGMTSIKEEIKMPLSPEAAHRIADEIEKKFRERCK